MFIGIKQENPDKIEVSVLAEKEGFEPHIKDLKSAMNTELKFIREHFREH